VPSNKINKIVLELYDTYDALHVYYDDEGEYFSVPEHKATDQRVVDAIKLLKAHINAMTIKFDDVKLN